MDGATLMLVKTCPAFTVRFKKLSTITIAKPLYWYEDSPSTVRTYVPGGVEAEVDTVNVVVQFGVHVETENEPVAPAGKS